VTERALLAAALRGLVAAGVLALLWVGWQMARGPLDAPAVPSVRVARLAPGNFIVVDAPALPAGARGPLKLLVLRQTDGLLRGYYLPVDGGQPAVPVSGALVGGVPCDDFAPDFASGDIGCRQARAGFDFALRPRWALDGRAQAPHLPDLLAAKGREVDGDWLLQAVDGRR
jgi:hypothetical protein